MNRPIFDLAVPESISVWLTRREWLCVFGFQFVASTYPAYGAERMSLEERSETFTNSLARAMAWAIRELYDHGYRFEAIEISSYGKIVPIAPEPIEPRNKLFLWTLAQGKMVSPIVAIETALEELERQNVSIDTSHLCEVLAQVRSDVEAAKAELDSDPETARIVQEEVKAQLPRALEILRTVIPPDEKAN